RRCGGRRPATPRSTTAGPRRAPRGRSACTTWTRRTTTRWRDGVTVAIFYLAGAGALGSALAAVIQRHPCVAALALILNLASLATVGRVFLTNYLLAFELVSILLLVGAVAGVVLGAGHLLHSSEEGTARIREGGPPPAEPRAVVPAEPAPPEPVREEVAP